MTQILTAAPGVGGSYEYNPDTGSMELIEFTDDPAQFRPPGFDVVARDPEPENIPQVAIKIDLPPQE